MTEIRFVVFKLLCLVPGNYTKGKSQARLLPRVSGHPHTQGEHRGQGPGVGATQLPGGEVSD